jgi:hypothetical protein
MGNVGDVESNRLSGIGTEITGWHVGVGVGCWKTKSDLSHSWVYHFGTGVGWQQVSKRSRRGV